MTIRQSRGRSGRHTGARASEFSIVGHAAQLTQLIVAAAPSIVAAAATAAEVASDVGAPEMAAQAALESRAGVSAVAAAWYRTAFSERFDHVAAAMRVTDLCARSWLQGHGPGPDKAWCVAIWESGAGRWRPPGGASGGVQLSAAAAATALARRLYVLLSKQPLLPLASLRQHTLRGFIRQSESESEAAPPHELDAASVWQTQGRTIQLLRALQAQMRLLMLLRSSIRIAPELDAALSALDSLALRALQAGACSARDSTVAAPTTRAAVLARIVGHG